MDKLIETLNNLNQLSNLELWDIRIQMLANIVVIGTLGWAIYEFVRRNRRARAEKAIELANDFEKEIIPMINSMSWLFTFLPFYNKLDKMDYEKSSLKSELKIHLFCWLGWHSFNNFSPHTNYLLIYLNTYYALT